MNSRELFNRWLKDHNGEQLVSTTTRVWDGELNAARDQLFALFEFGIQVGRAEIELERAKVVGLTYALQAKQNIQVGLFSIFKRTPTNDRP